MKAAVLAHFERGPCVSFAVLAHQGDELIFFLYIGRMTVLFRNVCGIQCRIIMFDKLEAPKNMDMHLPM